MEPSPLMNLFIISHGFQVHYTLGFTNGVASDGINPTLVHSSNLQPSSLEPNIRSVDFGQNLGNEKSLAEKVSNFLRYNFLLFARTLGFRRKIVHIIGLFPNEWINGILQGFWFRLFNKKYLLTVHNLLPHEHHTLYKWCLYWIIYRIPSRLIVHTDKMKQDLVEQYGISDRHIMVVEHGINDEVPITSLTKDESRKVLGLDTIQPQPIVLLFFGRISPYKGLDKLIEAFGKLDQRFHLVIAGRAKTEYAKVIDAAIEACPTKSRISYFNDWIEDDEIERFFKAADYLILPYKHIDQSGVIFLSFKFGLPIIATDVGSVKNYIGDIAGITVPSCDPDQLAKSIMESASSNKFDSEQIKTYSHKFDWKNTLKPLLRYYNDHG